jgi:ornithine cyclodeaminase/alanine dehydrogenase-like protein (mu-crystallin family)
MSVLILGNSEVEELLSMKECIAVMRDALVALARGEVFQPLRSVVKPPDAAGLLGLMPSFISGNRPALGLKAISVFPGNAAKGKDIHQGVVLLLDPETGELRAIMNASAVTSIRTAAVSGVATDLLARADASVLAIIGTGVQARSHLKAMSEVRVFGRCRVASRSNDKARAFANELQKYFSFPIEPVESAETAVENADVIVTATTASEPVIRREWIADGAHINAVGACIPTVREIDGATMAAASVFVDRRESAVNEAGDYLLAFNEGVIGPDNIHAEIGEALNGDKTGRTSRDEITLFKSLGLAVEDVAAAEYLYRKAEKLNAGAWVNF